MLMLVLPDLLVRSDEVARRCLVRQRPAEINLGFDELAVLYGQHFRVTKRFAGMPAAFIGDEYLVASCTKYQLEVGDISTVAPAAREVGRPVEAIVERAGEMKVLSDEHSIRNRPG